MTATVIHVYEDCRVVKVDEDAKPSIFVVERNVPLGVDSLGVETRAWKQMLRIAPFTEEGDDDRLMGTVHALVVALLERTGNPEVQA